MYVHVQYVRNKSDMHELHVPDGWGLFPFFTELNTYYHDSRRLKAKRSHTGFHGKENLVELNMTYDVVGGVGVYTK